MGRRLGALAVAVLLVVGAVAVRRWIDTGGEVSLGGTPSPVYCDSLVADACRQAFSNRELIIENPGVTLDRLVEQRDAESILWVTSQLWIDILSSERARLGRSALVESVQSDLAHSDVVLIAESRAIDACGGALSWSCLASGDAGLEVGLDNRSTSVGLLSRGALVAAFFGTPNFATNDLGADYGQWRSRIANDVTELPSSRVALNQMLTVRGRFDSVSSAAVTWDGLARDGFEAISPADGGPPIVVAMAALGKARGSADDLVVALTEQGWTAGPGPSRSGPAAGVYLALRNE